MQEHAAVLESLLGKGHRCTLGTAIQKCCAGLWRSCSLGYFTLEICLQRERTPLLTSDTSSCICSQLWKKMFGLPAWAKVNHESVAEDSMPRVPEEVISTLDMVFPWSHPAVEESHWKGRGAEQDAPIVNNNFWGLVVLIFFSSLLWMDPLLGQVEVLNSPYLGFPYFYICILKHKSLKCLYQVRAKHERLLSKENRLRKIWNGETIGKKMDSGTNLP